MAFPVWPSKKCTTVTSSLALAPFLARNAKKLGRLDATHQESCEVNHLHFEVRYRQGLYHEALEADPETKDEWTKSGMIEVLLGGGGVVLLNF